MLGKTLYSYVYMRTEFEFHPGMVASDEGMDGHFVAFEKRVRKQTEPELTKSSEISESPNGEVNPDQNSEKERLEALRIEQEYEQMQLDALRSEIDGMIDRRPLPNSSLEE